MIEEVFGEREKIKLEEFSEIVEKVTSEMFLAVSRLGTKYIDCHLTTVLASLQRELFPLQKEL